jgi:muramoyltetrapeptide carboxypeptidase
MNKRKMRIGVVAPGSRISPATAEKVCELAAELYPSERLDVQFHPQCHLSEGHFAGSDSERARAFLEIANDETFDALWFARGGYGSCRLVPLVLPNLTAAAKRKTYLGYSDAGSLFAALYRNGFSRLAHGPMISDVNREGGEGAIERALAFLVERDRRALEPTVSNQTLTAAFNITILSHVLGTPWQPDLGNHILMLEEVSEHMYRIDRALCHITSNPDIRKISGIRLGRCSAIPPNDPEFGSCEEDVAKHWCAASGIPYLGRADIGHDIGNKIVPFGRWPEDAA